MVLVFSNYFVYFYAACIVLTFAAVIWIIASRNHPDYKIAWIVPIMTVPVFGGLLYLCSLAATGSASAAAIGCGSWRSSSARPWGTAARSRTFCPPEMSARRSSPDTSPKPACIRPTPTPKRHITPWGRTCLRGMLEELEQAEHYIFLQYFIIQEGEMWDAILEILERKAAAGLDVRVLYDDIGCLFTLPKHYLTLREKDCLQGIQPFRRVYCFGTCRSTSS